MLAFDWRHGLGRLHKVSEILFKRVLSKGITKQVRNRLWLHPPVEDDLQVHLFKGLYGVVDDMSLETLPAHVSLDPSENRVFVLTRFSK
jgi:hypothetical protein